MCARHCSDMSTPETVLLDLGHRLGIEGLSFSANGLCELVFDGNLRTVTTCIRQGWVSAVQLQAHPLPAGDALCSVALEANFLWRGAQGATLALDSERRLWAQVLTPGQTPDPEQLLKALERLLDVADAWRSGSTERRPPQGVLNVERSPSFLMNRA